MQIGKLSHFRSLCQNSRRKYHKPGFGDLSAGGFKQHFYFFPELPLNLAENSAFKFPSLEWQIRHPKGQTPASLNSRLCLTELKNFRKIKFRGFQTLHRDFRSSLKDVRQLHWIAVYALLNWGTFGIKFRGFQTLHRDFRSSLNDVHIACGFHTEVHTEGTVCPQYVRALLKIAIFKLFYFIKFESDLYERFAVCRWNPNIV